MRRVTADVYIVQVWLESSQEGFTWRASLTDAKAQQKYYFANPEALINSIENLVNFERPKRESKMD
jgi:hypothetical protein